MNKKPVLVLFAILLPMISFLTRAGEVLIEKVVMQKTGNSWSFDVTLKHGDTGWKHYADAWRVLDGKGKVIKTRILFHPHVNEQPFTRGLGGVVIREGTKSITVEARDKLHGWSKNKVLIDLGIKKGKRYVIKP